MYFSYPSWSGSAPDPSMAAPPPGQFTAQEGPSSKTYYSKPWTSKHFYEFEPAFDGYRNPNHDWRYTNPRRAADDIDSEYVRPVQWPPPPRPHAYSWATHIPPPPPQQPPYAPYYPYDSKHRHLRQEFFDFWDFIRLRGVPPNLPTDLIPPYPPPHLYPHPPPPPGHACYQREAHERWAAYQAQRSEEERARYEYSWERRRGAWNDWGRRFPPRTEWEPSSHGLRGEWYQPPPRRTRSTSESRGRARPTGRGTDEWSWWHRMPPPFDSQLPPRPQPRPSPDDSPEPFETTLTEAFAAYEAAWANACDGAPLTFRTVPWPQHPPPQTIDDITTRRVHDFLSAGGRTLKIRLREALLRFHPDKIAPLLVRVVESEDKERVAAACESVTRCLGDLMRSATL